MIKVTTESKTVYIIDTENKQIKRIPRPGSEISSVMRGMINIGEFQPYTDLSDLEVGKNLYVTYPNIQLWTLSTNIIEIEIDFKEETPDDYLDDGVKAAEKFSGVQLAEFVENFKICDDPECNDEMEDIIQSYREKNDGE